jgi:NADPH:quinone reductase-like Zn-dependent oxidoreductase
MPPTQKALHLPYAQGPYTPTTRPVPSSLGPTDVLVKLEAVALNPSEWKLQKIPEAAKFIQAYPAMCGSDGAGVVVEVGSEVVGVGVGDRV